MILERRGVEMMTIEAFSAAQGEAPKNISFGPRQKKEAKISVSSFCWSRSRSIAVSNKKLWLFATSTLTIS